MPEEAPEETESTPLLYRSQSNAISEEEEDTISAHSLRPQSSYSRMGGSYRRPSFVSGGIRGLLLSSSPVPDYALRDDEAFERVRDERDLLKRNSIAVPAVTDRRGSSVASAAAVEEIEQTWEEAVKEGRIKTSWKYELAVMLRYSVFSC